MCAGDQLLLSLYQPLLCHQLPQLPLPPPAPQQQPQQRLRMNSTGGDADRQHLLLPDQYRHSLTTSSATLITLLPTLLSCVRPAISPTR